MCDNPLSHPPTLPLPQPLSPTLPLSHILPSSLSHTSSLPLTIPHSPLHNSRIKSRVLWARSQLEKKEHTLWDHTVPPTVSSSHLFFLFLVLFLYFFYFFSFLFLFILPPFRKSLHFLFPLYFSPLIPSVTITVLHSHHLRPSWNYSPSFFSSPFVAYNFSNFFSNLLHSSFE